MVDKYYTGIGSRETPQEIRRLMSKVALKLQRLGYILRSGGADGADHAFESAITDNNRKEIYIPWRGFNKRCGNGVYALEDLLATKVSKAESMVWDIHPAPERLNPAPLKLHTRNMFQVLGKDLNTRSRFVILYAEPTHNGVKGGTNTAFTLAEMYGVESFNLWDKEVVERFKKFVK